MKVIFCDICNKQITKLDNDGFEDIKAETEDVNELKISWGEYSNDEYDDVCSDCRSALNDFLTSRWSYNKTKCETK